jgi:hypothetical protein
MNDQETIIEITEDGRVIDTGRRPVDRMNRPEMIRRAVLAAHGAVLRMMRTRSRTALLKNGKQAFGELETILDVVGHLRGTSSVSPEPQEEQP